MGIFLTLISINKINLSFFLNWRLTAILNSLVCGVLAKETSNFNIVQIFFFMLKKKKKKIYCLFNKNKKVIFLQFDFL